MSRVVLLVTTPRVAPGALTWDAWSALRSGPVFTRDQDHPQLAALAAASIAVEAVDPTLPAIGIARLLRSVARESQAATWLAGPGGDQDVARALGEIATQPEAAQSEGGGGDVEIEVLPGNWDLPGARLLDVVATMDRLRSPGGCPWDAEQTHASLAPYLLEEAYEAFEAIEDGDDSALLEELGDVLLQVAFHARVAEENDADTRWSIDDVAAGLVDKLVRRHPHVFGDRTVSGAAEVQANWDDIKAAEKSGRSPLAGVPLGMAALTLAAKLQRKAQKADIDAATGDVDAALTAYRRDPTDASAGELLWSAVAMLRSDDIDAEVALRARSREFRNSFG